MKTKINKQNLKHAFFSDMAKKDYTAFVAQQPNGNLIFLTHLISNLYEKKIWANHSDSTYLGVVDNCLFPTDDIETEPLVQLVNFIVANEGYFSAGRKEELINATKKYNEFISGIHP